jgi:hypothetical protein
MPLNPFRVAFQNCASPSPLGLTTPIPVTATRRLHALVFILVPRLEII